MRILGFTVLLRAITRCLYAGSELTPQGGIPAEAALNIIKMAFHHLKQLLRA
jgi:hypothetical protein